MGGEPGCWLATHENNGPRRAGGTRRVVAGRAGPATFGAGVTYPASLELGAVPRLILRLCGVDTDVQTGVVYAAGLVGGYRWPVQERRVKRPLVRDLIHLGSQSRTRGC